MNPTEPDPNNLSDGAARRVENLAQAKGTSRAERWLRSLVQNSSDVIAILEDDGTVRYMSPSVERILGYKPEELVGTSAFNHIHPEDAELASRSLSEALRNGGVTPPVEFRVRAKDGSWQHMEAILNNLLDDPDVGGIVVNSRDITERKRIEEELRSNEASLTEAQRLAHLGSWEQDLITGEGWWSDESYRIFGLDSEKETAPNREKFLDLVHPDDRQPVQESIRRAISGGEEFSVEFRIVRPDGLERILHTRGEVVFGESGRPVRLRGTNHDITERKKAEEEIRFRSGLLDAVGQAVIATDPEGKVLYWNRAAQEMYGWSAKEVMGHPVLEIIPSEELVEQAGEIMSRLRAGESWSGELLVRRKDGTTFPVLATGTPVRDERGNLVGMIGVSTDITERKEAEEEKSRQARHAALRADVSASLAGGGILQTILQRCTESMIRHLGAAFARIWTLNEEENVLELKASAGMYTHLDGAHSRVPVGRFKIGLIAQERLPHLTNDVVNDPRVSDKEWAEREGMVAFAGYPLIVEDRLVGVMAMFARQPLGKNAIEALASVADAIAQGIKRKRTEEALQKSESSLATAQRIAHLGNWEYDIAKDEAQWSDEMYRIFGFTPQQFVPTYKTFLSSVHPDDRDLIRRSVRKALYEEKQGGVDYRIVRPDGEIRVVQSYYEVIREVSNRAVKLIGTVHNITERKEAEQALKQSEERYRAVIEQTIEGIYLGAADTKLVLESNAAFQEMLGYTAQELRGMHIYDFVAHDHENIDSVFQCVLDKGHHFIGERKYRRKDGSVVDVETSATVISYDNREVLCTVVRDVTERKETEEALKESERRFATLLHNAPAVVYRCVNEPDWPLEFISDYVLELTGYSAEEYLDNNTDLEYGHLILEEDQGRVWNEVQAGIERRERFKLNYSIRHKDGTIKRIEEFGQGIYDQDGSVLALEGLLTDITERKALEEQLRHRALHDSLTDLPNRQLFVDRLGQALGRTRRRQGRKVGVLFMDLDDFKAINDSLGHEMGDLLLVVVSQRLGRCLRPEDTLARFGGDEFVVLIEDVESPEDAVRVAERIVEGLREPFVVDGRELFLRASIGIAMGTSRQKSAEDLLRDADTAMYEAKEERLGYRVFDPAMYERAVGRLELENELRRAIEAEQFVVHYQPIMTLQTGEVREMEALVRWNHPARGLLDPWEFMAVAEQSGIVVPMGERVLKEACRQAKEWQVDHPRIPPLVMSVNLSARQLQRPDIAQIVERVLNRTGLEARYLRLDITETTYIKALEGNTRALDELKRIGVCISIDDFGTGYSSLAYLKRLPANALKIDKSFIKGIGEDLEDTAIVRMVIELAHTLGMEVIAEGVESAAQATLLKEMGCDLAQGFYFSEPLPPEAVTTFLAEEQTS